MSQTGQQVGSFQPDMPAPAKMPQKSQVSSSASSSSSSSVSSSLLSSSNPRSSNTVTSSSSPSSTEAGAQQVQNNGQEQPEASEIVRKFSEKSLNELADYYLDLKPADIPDSGFVVSGIAGRFPNADNLNELWDNLRDGRDMVCGPDNKRWPLGLWDLPKKAARIKDISNFDNEFFGIPKETADYTDHQLRNLYEVVYESMLDAGLNPAKMRGDKRLGIFFGFHTNETENEFMERPHFKTTGYQSQLLTAVTNYFDIQGVAGSYDAACASSFAAFHQAVLNLKTGLVDTAIVCGVNISVRPGTAYQFLLLQMLSPTGSSKFLDASADGYAKTEACVSVILQRKDIAKRSYAAIVHTKCNNDGFKVEGITYPSSKVQEALMSDAIVEAGVDPKQIVYVEAHGTGTPAGDPEEARAIAKVYCENRDQPLLIGSVKSNMGHAEGVSGLCSLAKVICTFENELLPKNLHYNKPNPNIQPLLDGSLVPVVDNIPFKHNLIPMNCYGFGGVNVHGIFKTHSRKLDESRDYDIAPEFPRLITMFGRSPAAIEHAFSEFKSRKPHNNNKRLLTRDFLALIDSINEGPIDRLMNYRGYLLLDNELNEIASSVVNMAEPPTATQITASLIKNDRMGSTSYQVKPAHYQDYRRQLWLVLPGLGCQWRAMGAGLRGLPPVWSTIEKLADVLKPLGVDLIKVLTNSDSNEFEGNCVHLFTGIVAVQIALIDLIRKLEVQPAGIIGHSIGEISCAYADGHLTAQETILLAYHLAKPIDEAGLHQGAMAAVSLSAKQAQSYMESFDRKSLELACVNGDESVTISGASGDVEDFVNMLIEENVYARCIIDVKTAFHNSSLRQVESQMLAAVRGLFNNNPAGATRSKNWISTSLEESKLGFQVDAKYFVDNLCSQVRFREAVDNIKEPEHSIVLELGPHGLFQPILKQKYLTKLNYVSLMKRMDGKPETVLQGLGQLYQYGQSLKLAKLYPAVELPVAKGTGSVSSILQWNHSQKFHVAKYPEAFRRPPCEARVKFDLIDESDKYLAGHCVDGRVLFPATGYMYLVWRSFSLTKDKVGNAPIHQDSEATLVPVEFTNVRLYRATILGSAPVELQIRIEEATGQFEVKEGGSVVADGYIALPTVNPDGMQYSHIRESAAKLNKPIELDSADVYRQFRVCGYDYGESFRNITGASADGLHVQVKWPGQFIPFSDSVLQSLFLAICKKTSSLFLPTKFEYMRVNPQVLQAKIDAAQANDKPCILDAYCELETGIIVTDGMEMRGVGASPAPRRLQQDPVLESYQFVANVEHSVSDKLAEQGNQLVRRYQEMCSAAAHKALRNLGDDSSQSFDQLAGSGFKLVQDDELIKYFEENEASEQHVLLKLLDRLLESQELPDEPAIERGGLEPEPEVAKGTEDKSAAAPPTAEKTAQPEEPAKRKRQVAPKLKPAPELRASLEKTLMGLLDELAPKMGADLASSAFGRERLLRPMLEIAFENAPTQKLKFLELTPGDHIKFESVSNIAQEVLPNLSINYFLGHPNTGSLSSNQLPPDTKLYTWTPAAKMLARDLVDLDVVMYSDASLYPIKKEQFSVEIKSGEPGAEQTRIEHEDPKAVMSSISDTLRPFGFVLAMVRTQLSAAERLIYKLADLDLSLAKPERLDLITEAAQAAHLELVAEKSDPNGCYLLLFRKLDPESPVDLEKQQFLHIEHGKHSNWLEALKWTINEIKAKPATETVGQNVWLIANDTQNNGIVGMVNCLRKEPGGERVRYLLDQRQNSPIKLRRRKLDFERVIKAEKEGDEDKREPVSSDAFIELESIREDPMLVQLVKQDLIYNCIEPAGQYGSFRHFFISDILEQQKIKTSNAFINVATRGDLSSFRWYEAPYKYLDINKDTQLVSIYYSSLNFRDIMLASGRLPLDALPISIALSDCILGLEFSGRMSDGRRVAGMLGGRGIATKALFQAESSISFNVPDCMSLEEAATIPVVYSTAVMALYTRGRMRAGETILIHSGSGGVGQAAIQLALHEGLTVYTTVGNQEKRDFLKEEFPKLTDANIFNSRDCSFETDVMRATNGRGVDLVLNSLAEDKLQASVRCLADGGRFLEIGKYDMALNNPVELMLLDTNKTFHGILLDKLFDTPTITEHFRVLIRELKERIDDGLASGYIRPIRRTVFDKSQVEDAFRFMASGKHIGKVLLKVRDEECVPTELDANGKQLYRTQEPYDVVMDSQPRTMFNPKGSYIITGGLGGFGLELAKWFVANGAAKLVLTSRTGIRTGYQSLVVDRMRENGCQVFVSTVDINTDEGAEQLVREAEELGPLVGIFNLAMVLKDSLFENSTVEQFDAVFAPKCLGVAALDRVTRKLGCKLELFVAFSSVSCGKGNAGQVNYGYSNSVMERICEQRRRDGLHGCAIQWGAIGDVGVAFESLGGNEAVIGGTIPQRMPSCFATLSKLLASPFSVTLSILQADRRSFSAGKKGDLVKTILHVLGIKDPSTVDPNCTLGELGLDSLMAVEIRQALEREYEIVLTVQEIRALTINRIREIGDGECVKKNKEDSSAGTGGGLAGPVETDELGLNRAQQQQKYTTESRKELPVEVPGISISKTATGTIAFTVDKTAASKWPLSLASDDLLLLNGDTGISLTGNPIFVVPPIQGDFARMAVLTKRFTRPCVGICWTQRMAKLATIEEVVQEHLKVIREYYPTLRQLDIIGYSFGAAVAFEVMLATQESTLKPPLNPGKLILLDGSPDQINIGVRYITNTFGDKNDEATNVAEIMVAFLMQHARFDYQELRKQVIQQPTHEAKLHFVTDLLAKQLGIKDAAEIEHLAVAIEAFCRRFQIMLNYKAKDAKLDSGVTLIRATEVYVGAKDSLVDEDYGLNKLVQGNVKSCLIKGNHESFLDDNIEQVSSLLQDIICPILE